MTLIFRLADYGKTFSTRPRAAELRDELIGSVRDDAFVVVDCAGVLSVSYSFADEFAGALAVAQDSGDLAFATDYINATSEVQRVLDRAFLNRFGEAGLGPDAPAARADTVRSAIADVKHRYAGTLRRLA